MLYQIQTQIRRSLGLEKLAKHLTTQHFRFSRQFWQPKMTGSTKTLSLADYDAIGFDMDHTLAKYDIPHLFRVSNLINMTKPCEMWTFFFSEVGDKMWICCMWILRFLTLSQSVSLSACQLLVLPMGAEAARVFWMAGCATSHLVVAVHLLCSLVKFIFFCLNL